MKPLTTRTHTSETVPAAPLPASNRGAKPTITGHRTESVYRRYAIVAEADLAEGVAKLARMQDRDGQRVVALRAAAAETSST